MNAFSNFYHKILNAIRGEAQEVQTVLKPSEDELLQGFSALLHQIEQSIGEKGLAIIKKGFLTIADDVIAGKDIGATVSAVTKEAKAEANQDVQDIAENASKGAASLILALLKSGIPLEPVTDSDTAKAAE